MKTEKYYLLCDLKKNQELIQEYKRYHEHGNVWPEIIDSIKESGIVDMQIYLLENRLMMVIEVNETFSFERKHALDTSNLKVQQWEALMEKYQQLLPWSENGVKWMPMEKIFQLPTSV